MFQNLLLMLSLIIPGVVTAQNLSDGQILSVLQTVNGLEIEAGQNAEKKAVNPEVKRFAKQMAVDHKRSQGAAGKIMKSLNEKAGEIAAIVEIKEMAAESKKKLNGLSGAEFEKTFVDNQIKMHQTVLQKIRNEMLPSVESGDLKALLAENEEKIEAHLRHAETLKKQL